ncbi:MAG TPA: ATP-binding protein, partial [Hyalangium sp.]|nr:ATP-binding protein [Hyalangium sp.]
PSPLSEPRGKRRGPYAWFLAGLDWFLSEHLRRSPAQELARARLIVGATLFLSVGSLSFPILVALGRQAPTLMTPTIVTTLGYAGALLLVRRARSIQAPAMLLCMSLATGLVWTLFILKDPYAGRHGFYVLLPILSVYLVGARLGLIITAFMAITVGIILPAYLRSLPVPPPFQSSAFFQVFAFLGAWVLSVLYSSSRDEAQKGLSQSQASLLSLIESTDDLVCSLDLTGSLLFANSAMRHEFSRRFGQELVPGQSIVMAGTAEQHELWVQQIARAASGQRLRFEEEYVIGERRSTYEVNVNPVQDDGGRVMGMTVFSRDITSRKESESRLGEMHRTLVDVSRLAGMAEIATGVLHNVGNTLNSLNVSTQLLDEQIRTSRIAALAKVTRLLREHAHDLGTFITTTSQGQKLPAYLIALFEHLTEERTALSKEVAAISKSVEHIDSIVTMQQKYARTIGALEELPVPQLIDEALRLHAVSFERLGITIERDYAQVPPIVVDRHKLLQILMNLLTNARHALVESGAQEKRLSIRVRQAPEGQQLLVEVADNGVGIAPENMQRMFTQGFTTKKTGHGFGLHISALAATEMKGRLSCTSPGAGQGATFTLELPVIGQEEHV